MKRLVMLLVIAIFILIVLAFFIIQGGEIAGLIQRGQGAISLILILLQLVGVLLGLVLATFVIGQYIRYLRPRHFIFEGFSNTSKFLEAEKWPCNLNSLAQEALVNQLEELYSNWTKTSSPSDIDLLFVDDQRLKEDPNVSLPPEEITRSGMMKDLKAVISQQNPKNSDLLGMIGEIVPKEASVIARLINELIPPHAIKATGYLQWHHSTKGTERIGITLELEDLGNQRNLMLRTFWLPFPTRSSSKCNKDNNQTPSEEETLQIASCYVDLLAPAMHWLALLFFEQQQTLHIPFPNRIPLINRLPNLSQRERKRQAQLHYILEALYFDSATQYTKYTTDSDCHFFWELALKHFRQAINLDPHWYLPYLHIANVYGIKMEKQIKCENTELSNTKLSSELLEYALDFYDKAFKLAEKPVYDRQQKTSTQERDASRSVTIPVGNIQEINHERRERFKKSRDCIRIEKSEQKNTELEEYPQIPVQEREYNKQKVIIARAWTELVWCANQKEARTEREEFVRTKVDALISLDPANFDPKREDCGTYLYDLMSWYLTAAILLKDQEVKEDQKTKNSSDMDHAKLYLAYCLARSWDMRTIVYRALRNIGRGNRFAFIGYYYLKNVENALEKFREKEEKKYSKYPDFHRINEASADDFKIAIREVIKNCVSDEDEKEAIIQCMSPRTGKTERGQ